LKVVHLQSYVSFQGNAPLRLHEAMLSHHIDSKIIDLKQFVPAMPAFKSIPG
jgi:hypothetical protein